MAIQAVKQMVKDRLPYLSDVSNDQAIERMRIEVVYIMQGQSGKSDADVELEAGYTSLQNIMFAAMVSYYLLRTKAVMTAAGDGTTGSTGGGKMVKRAKADVTEVEFMTTTAADGNLISIRASDLLNMLKDEACRLSQMIGWANPLCNFILDVIPAFIIGSDFPPYCIDGFPNGVWPHWPEGTV